MEEQTSSQPAWKPLSSIERRVLGVLVEKAKTTPDAYPLTLNALRNGCNQKSNRDPQMDLNEDQLEDALEDLRQAGAVLEVQGGGRTAKYRHAIYEWMGVDKVEAAVMTELLLRGAQTVGELRGRAARMEKIADLAALKPVVDALKSRGLIIGLTPEGRGHIVTHALYSAKELERLKRDHNTSDFDEVDQGSARVSEPQTSASTPSTAAAHADSARMPSAASQSQAPHSTAAQQSAAHTHQSQISSAETANLANDLSQIRAEFAAAQREFEEAIAELQQRVDELERFRQDVGG